MVLLNSVTSLQSALTFAERKVQRDRDQVAQDEDRLDSSRAALDRDSQDRSRIELESRRAEAAAAPALSSPRLDRAIEQRIPAGALPKAPTLNALGQAIGQLIDIEV